MRCRYSLGSNHRVIWNQVTSLVLSLVHVPPLDGDRRIQDWMLQKGNIVMPINIKITTHSMYMLLQTVARFHEHANAIWNLYKTQSLWKNRLTSLWSFGLPLKQRVLCILGVLPTGSNLQKWSIASSHCVRCGGWLETFPHLLWTCSFTTTFVQRRSASLSHRFHGPRFEKHFWLFGQILCALSNNVYFLRWTRFWALWTIWTVRNYKVFHGNQLHEVRFFKQSLKQSLFDCLQLRDIALQNFQSYFQSLLWVLLSFF